MERGQLLENASAHTLHTSLKNRRLRHLPASALSCSAPRARVAPERLTLPISPLISPMRCACWCGSPTKVTQALLGRKTPEFEADRFGHHGPWTWPAVRATSGPELGTRSAGPLQSVLSADGKTLYTTTVTDDGEQHALFASTRRHGKVTRLISRMRVTLRLRGKPSVPAAPGLQASPTSSPRHLGQGPEPSDAFHCRAPGEHPVRRLPSFFNTSMLERDNYTPWRAT